MSITSAAAAVTINSPAANGTLDAQVADNSASNIVFPDTIVAANNGNLDDRATFPRYENRLVIIRRGDSDEEVRYITVESSADANGDVTCSISEDWVSPPESGDTYDISYITFDANTIGARFTVVQKRVTDWTLSVPFVIGDESEFAFFSILDGHTIESDNSITPASQEAFRVSTGSRLDIGYQIVGDKEVSTGQLFSTADVDADPAILCQSGSEIRFYFATLQSVKNNTCRFHGKTTWEGGRMFSSAGDFEMTGSHSGSILLKDVLIEGKGGSDNIIIDSTFACNGLDIVSTNGFTGSGLNTSAETMSLFKPFFVNNSRMVKIDENKTWHFVNPTSFNPSTASNSESDIQFGNNVNNVFKEFFTIDISTKESDGSIISESIIYIYEGLLNQNLPNTASTNDLGTFAQSVLTREFHSGSDDDIGLTVTQSGDFTLKVYRFPKSPFVSALGNLTDPVDLPVTLITDVNITDGVSQSQAINDGSGISVTQLEIPTTLLGYISGSETFSVGELVQGEDSTAFGTVISKPETDAGAGTGQIYLDPRNDANFQFGEVLSGSFTGLIASSSTTGQDFTWRIECNDESLQTTYDFLAANMAHTSALSIFTGAIEWGEDEVSQLMSAAGGDTYFTKRNVNLQQGVFLSNPGIGTITSLTDDSGGLYVPPIQVTLKIESAAANAQCAIFASGSSGPEDNGKQLMNELADGTGVATEGYLFTTEQLVVIRVRKAGFLPFSVGATIQSNGLTIQALALDDPNFE